MFDAKKVETVADKEEAAPPEEQVKHDTEFKQFWNKLLQLYSGGSK